MELRLLPPLVAFEVNLLLGLFALIRGRRDLDHLYFAGFALTASIWCLGSSLYFLLPDFLKESALSIGFAGGTAIPAVYLAFSINKTSQGSIRRWGAALVAVYFLLNLLANLHPLVRGDALKIVSRVQVAAMAAYFGALYVLSFSMLRKKLTKLEEGPGREETEFILFGGALPFAFMLFYSGATWFLAGFMPRPNVLLPVVIGAELMLYHGVKFKRVALDEMLSTSLMYLTYSVALTGIIFLAVFAVSKLTNLEISGFEFILLVAFCLASAFAFTAGRDRLQTWVDAALFPDKLEYRRMIVAYEEELKDARESLYRAERLAMLGELSARVAHEIKNPLGPIKGYTQMLIEARKKGALSDTYLDKALAIIAEETDRIDERVKGFLDLARRETPDKVETNINEVVTRSIELLGPGKGLVIENNLMAKPPNILADHARIQGAIYNVLLNAAQAMEWEGRLRIETAEKDSWVTVTISDSGPGIAPDLLKEIFEPFRTGRLGGTGLGLAIVKSIIEAHGGSVEARSEEKKGASFIFQLPKVNTSGQGM